jgi:hypothetical protein
MTLTEVLVVICVIVLLAVLLLLYTAPRVGGQRVYQFVCVNNLKEMGLAYRVWQGDNSGNYPMAVSITNGGAMEMARTGNVIAIFQVMSNELSSPKILCCPADEGCSWATNFTTDFSARNISYFVSIDADETNPQMLMSGDDNFEIGGAPVKSGLLEIWSNTPIAWSAARHHFSGNLVMADGSVQSVANSGPANLRHNTGFFTNRLAIP